MNRKETEREQNALRDLQRIETEREKLLHGTPAADGDENDPAVICGKRIARILGPLVAVGLLLYLLLTYLPRA